MSSIETLRKIDFLKELSDENLATLALISREVEFGPRETIFCQHDSESEVFFIVHGEVVVAICDSRVGCRQITTVTDGGLLGWSPLLKRPRMSAAARTLTPVQAIAVDGEELLKLCKQTPSLGFEVMLCVANVLAERLTSTRLRLLEVGAGHLPEVQIESD